MLLRHGLDRGKATSAHVRLDTSIMRVRFPSVNGCAAVIHGLHVGLCWACGWLCRRYNDHDTRDGGDDGQSATCAN